MAVNKRVVDGFTVVPLKYSERSRGCHYLYVREHKVRETHPSKPLGRTVMVANVPPWCTEECFQRLFSACGKVEDVFFHENPTAGAPVVPTSTFFSPAKEILGFKVAYVVFKNPGGKNKATELPFDTALVASTKEHPMLTGYRKMCADYKAQHSFDSAECQKEVEEFMRTWDSKKAAEEEEEEEEGEPDEDGFVTVTRKGKKKGTPFTETMQNKTKENMRKKRKKKELKNFYFHQMKETALNQLRIISEKHAEDKKKIAQYKAARKFRPY